MSKSFADIFQSKKEKSNENSIINCQIIGRVKFDNRCFFVVDAKLKTEGLLPCNEVEELDLKIGDNIDLVISSDSPNGIIMSHKRAQKELLEKQIRDIFESKKSTEAKIVAEKENFYKVNIFGNTNALLMKNDADINDLEIGAVLNVYITKIFSGGNIYVSRSLQQAEANNLNFKTGDVVECIVKGMNDFFVFVEMPEDSVEGVIHFNDLSWRKINYPSDLVKEGDKIRAKVLKIENNFVVLGVKQAVIDKWSSLVQKYEIGKDYSGTIVEIKDSGIVIDLEEGLDGFCYLFDIFWNVRGRIDLKEKFEVGEKVRALITAIDHKRRRIQLSLKALMPNPFEDFVKHYKVGQILEGVVLNDASTYGTFVFVELVPGVDGLLHCSEMSWNPEESQSEFNFLKEKQKVKVIISDINKESCKVAVSVKRIFKDSFGDKVKDLKVGSVYDCEVTQSSYDGLMVKLKDTGLDGFIRKNEISKERGFRNQTLVGTVIKAKLIAINHSKRDVLLSRKAYISEQDKDSIQNHSKNKTSSVNLMDFLDDQTKE